MVTKAGNYKHAIAWRVVSYQDAGTDLTHQKQLVLGSGGELGELDSLRSRRSPEQDAYIEGAVTNSPNSPPGSKPGELALGDPGDPPAGPCPNCQTEDEWGFTADGLSYYCTRCGYMYPSPGRGVSQ